MSTEVLLLALLLCDLYLLAGRRLRGAVGAMIAQGVILAVVPLLLGRHEPQVNAWHLAAVCCGTLLVKGLFIPALLIKGARAAGAGDETTPYLGRSSGAILGVCIVLVSLWVNAREPMGFGLSSGLLLPTAITSVSTGFLLLISRRNAINQVIGYLTLENGVFVFGQLLPGSMSLVAELGMLLDVLAGVAIMSIVIFHISRTFNHIDTHTLSHLRD